MTAILKDLGCGVQNESTMRGERSMSIDTETMAIPNHTPHVLVGAELCGMQTCDIAKSNSDQRRRDTDETFVTTAI